MDWASPELDFQEHQNTAIGNNGWPTMGRYVGLVIDEDVADPDNDWKLYLPIVAELHNDFELINCFGHVVVSG